MFKKILSLALICALTTMSLFPACPVSAQEKKTVNIAVLDLTANGISETESRALSDIMRGTFAEIISSSEFREKSGIDYASIEQSQMDKIFDQFDIQNTGCTDITCAVQFGKMLSAERIVIGSIGMVGETYSIQARIVDVESSRILTVSNKTYKGSRDRLLTAVIPEVVRELVYGKSQKKSKKMYYIVGGAIIAAGAAAAVLGGGGGDGGSSGGGEGSAVIDIIISE